MKQVCPIFAILSLFSIVVANGCTKTSTPIPSDGGTQIQAIAVYQSTKILLMDNGTQAPHIMTQMRSDKRSDKGYHIVIAA